jgi:hypothetical protein
MIDRCWSGGLHAFTVDKSEIVCADCLMSHEKWRDSGGLEASYTQSVLARWLGAIPEDP